MPRNRLAHSPTIDEPVAQLRSTDGMPVPLKGVRAEGRLEGLLFELTVEQRYQNSSTGNLEAVFTFPLPLRAVLLGFDLELGDRKLKAHAIASQQASEQYERAVDKGNTAALIEHDGHGLYTVSLGNLMAGETAVIRYRYAELLDAHDHYVRLNVPTVIAPRYGNPKDAGLEGPAVPGVDLLGEYPFEISIDLVRVTNVIGLRSPSHEIVTTVREDGLTVRLTRASFLDRDFVLELDQAAVPQQALVARDGDGYVMLATAVLGLDQPERHPLALKILLDCSGSMGGDSIAAARRALLAILERLTLADRVSLTRFGSSFQHVTNGLEQADTHSLAPLKALVRMMDADLGGTEMERALDAVLKLPAPRIEKPDVILITDGEIYDVRGVVDRVARAGHRLFAIAIGAAPNEALARALAELTGGACEFVAPNEDAEAAILRSFKRLRAKPRTLATVDWPMAPAWAAPLPCAVFPGDTLHLIAGFAAQPSGAVEIRVSDAAGQGTAIHVPVATHLTDGDLLPRLAASRRLSMLAEDDARELAVRYQFATEYTSFVVVATRADGEKAADLPQTVAVPQMLAAGWGGSSTVGVAAPNTPATWTCESLDQYSTAPASRSARRSPTAGAAKSAAKPAHATRPPSRSARDLALPDITSERADNPRSALQVLVARGLQQRFLTYSEIQVVLDTEGYDADLTDDVAQMIEDMGIEVRDRPSDAGRPIIGFPPNDQSRVITSLLEAFRRGDPIPTTVATLAAAYGLPETARSSLAALAEDDEWHKEAVVVAVFLALLADQPAAADLDPRFIATLKGTHLGDRGYRALRHRILQRLFDA